MPDRVPGKMSDRCGNMCQIEYHLVEITGRKIFLFEGVEENHFWHPNGATIYGQYLRPGLGVPEL